MLLELLNIKPITTSMNALEQERQETINRRAWNDVSKQLNSCEMECNSCLEYRTVDVDDLMRHEAKCEEISNSDFIKAKDILDRKGVVEQVRCKFDIHQCKRCDRVFKNKYLLQQHNSRGKNPKGCLRVHINNMIKTMDDSQLMQLKELIKDNMII